MNFLAHLLLADMNNDSLIGQILGDFVKGRALQAYELEIRNAIVFHRKIDAFSDAHAVPRASRSRVSPQRRRFAGVIVDVCYDHFLARHWHRFNSEPLAAFCQRIYGRLLSDRRRHTAAVQSMLTRMVAYDWLGGYRSIDNIAIVLDRIAGRLTRGDRFLGGIIELTDHYRDFEEDFLCFFPELIDYSRNYIVEREAFRERIENENVCLCNG